MNSYKFNIPIFPLDNVIMLPGSYLPLNIFEKRYLNMIDDCLKTDSKLIGIIQPLSRIKKDLNAFLNNVGCYGKIVKYEETDKKTYLISIKGRSRFRIKTTYLTKRGYLKSCISENDFKDDTDEINIDKNFKFSNSNELKTVLKSYLKNKKLSSNWDYINATSNLNLVNQLSMICPFSIQEKQMLLESNSINDRYILLTSILQNSTSSNEEKKPLKH